MLLFIPITGFLDGINIEFQYISCYCLSSSILLSISLTHISIHLMLLFISERGSNENANRYFNTSHVTVYLYPAIPGNFVIQISIHLMLLFISLACYRCFLCQDFNTSHVTVYQFSQIRLIFVCLISIHLMLLFIRTSEQQQDTERISIHLMLLFIICPSRRACICANFNTSHVTVYLLSKYDTNSKAVFQYISCYCLSICPVEHGDISLHFNTSHVTVYRYRFSRMITLVYYFNTSHVTVYR